ncbi:putative two component, sigma54 specific, transcriptional regulator, Fis family [uncultured Desulfobacterium sp.]|uniref:Putative two component, sigma54 specific, transcriptional regulator, Fis family n=1 Tax=uncultured Desulfobacterium sp. TaxID=201089 RepID=A0A445N3M0_9BACT|nr:putative two component, sigma54 specific, transcriptional regulator, Fis family [uncultured Desulfobacterium sp.]
MSRILIVDDDKMICETMSRIIRDMGHNVTYALTLNHGLEKALSDDFDIVFLDVRLPDGNGLEKLPIFQASPSLPEVIIITGYADPDGAELAIRNHAWDYIKKPASIDSITLAITRAQQYRDGKSANKAAVSLNRMGIIGESPQVKECLDLVARAANSMANILIVGETGTGKELFARAIHANSPRSQMGFVPVDCASLPESLVESLLFGHTKGAFTGADKAEEGLIMRAHGGTLFLDEVGDLPMPIQKSFLRVLQERSFHPVGGSLELESDFRLISATNRNLDELEKTGVFREDLLFRLRTVTITLPPLREREEDIKYLALNYLEKLCDSHKTGMKGVSSDFFSVLRSYHWPGNIRELFNALESAFIQAQYETTIFPRHLPTNIRAQVVRSQINEHMEAQPDVAQTDKKEINILYNDVSTWRDYRKALIEDGEKQYLIKLMWNTGSNIKDASRLSGLSPSRLYDLLRKYKIPA